MKSMLSGLAIVLSAGAASAAPLTYEFVQTGASGPAEWSGQVEARVVLDAQVGDQIEVFHFISEEVFFTDLENPPTSSNLGPLVDFYVDFFDGRPLHITPATAPDSYFLYGSFAPQASGTLGAIFFAGHIIDDSIDTNFSLMFLSEDLSHSSESGACFQECVATGSFQLVEQVPEPEALALLAMGLIGIWRLRGVSVR